MKNMSLRFFALLLLVAMLIPFAAVPTDASEPALVPYGKSQSNPRYPGVTYEEIAPGIESAGVMVADDIVYHDTEAAAGAELANQMKCRDTVIAVGLKTTDGSKGNVDRLFGDLFNAAFVHTGVPTEGDYLAWQWGHWDAYVYPHQSGNYHYLYFVYYVQYYDTAEQEAEMNIAVTNLLEELDLYKESDYRKIRTIYDYICENIVYDHYHLNNPNHTLKYTAYAALVNGTAVCQGYALLFYRLALELGVDCRFIGGDAGEPHAWNIVELNGLYYNLDSTWDAGMTEYQFFLKNEINFVRHFRDPEYRTAEFYAAYPMASEDYNYETYNVAVPQKPYKITNVVSGVHVYWNAVNGVEKYGVWRSETGVNGTYKWIANPSTNHFTDTSVISGKTYHYRITSMNPITGKHTEKSPAISAIYVSTPDISARYNKAAGIKLEWKQIPGATGYAVYRKSYSGNDQWVRVATLTGGNALTWTDTSVSDANGNVYKYTIRALAGANMKTLSGCRSAGRTMVRLTSRELMTNSPAAGTIKCEWNPTKAATGYELRFIANGEVVALITVGNYKTGAKLVSGLPAGQRYQVQVRSYKKVDGVGVFYSAWSAAKIQLA